MGKFNHRSDWQHKQERQETKRRACTTEYPEGALAYRTSEEAQEEAQARSP